MEAIKRKVVQMREEVNAADDKVVDLRHMLSDAKLRFDSAVTEKEYLLKRISVVSGQLDKAKKQHEGCLQYLGEFEDDADISESKRKGLEKKTLDDDKRCSELEEQVHSKQRALADAMQRLEDRKRKAAIIKEDLARVDKAYKIALEKGDYLEDELMEHEATATKIEKFQTEANQREMFLRDQIRYLESEYHQTDDKTKRMKSEISRMNRLVETLQDMIEEQRMKTRALQNDIDSTSIEIQKY